MLLLRDLLKDLDRLNSLSLIAGDEVQSPLQNPRASEFLPDTKRRCGAVGIKGRRPSQAQTASCELAFNHNTALYTGTVPSLKEKQIVSK